MSRDPVQHADTEEALRRSRAQLQAFIQHAPISIAMFDRGMNYLATSGRWATEYGQGLSDLIGRNHYEVIPDLPPEWKRAHQQALAGTPFVRDEDLWTRADGSRYWLRWAVLPWTDETGAIGGIIISTENITGRKRAEEALREGEERLAGIIDSAMDAVISIDDQQRIRVFNPAAALMFGLDADAAIGEPLARLIPERFRGAHVDHVRSFAHSGLTARRMGALGEVMGLRAGGEEFFAEASISKVTVASGQLLTVILRDVTARKQSEIALGQLRSEMDELLALHVASQTAAAIAHDLNQPLNAIASYCEAAIRLLRAGNPNPDQLLHVLRSSAEQSQRAGKVVRELIEFLQRGETVPEAVDLNDAVRRAIAVVEANGFGGFRAVIELDPSIHPVRANRLHIEKVLANLLRNGVEAMRSAGIRNQAITITVRTATSEDMAQVTVADTGPGLDQKTARRIFEPFFTTKPKGIGMGLAVSRALVEANGGRLWVELDSSHGATFHFTLPFAA